VRYRGKNTVTILANTYGGILLSNKKEWNTNTATQMVLKTCYMKEGNSKDHVLHDSIYLKYPE
jgi:hypothetical protein